MVLSAVSLWEVAIKYARGKLPLPEPPARWVPPRLLRDAVTTLPITPTHVLHVPELPLHHKDSFDRLLVAQSQVEGLPLVTADRKLAAYDVELVPAWE